MSHPPRQPADYGSPAWLFESLQEFRKEMIEDHKNLRSALMAITGKMEAHDEKDQAVENRVLKIEIERYMEKAEQEKRDSETALHRKKVIGDSSRISMIIAGTASIIVQIVKATWDSYHH